MRSDAGTIRHVMTYERHEHGTTILIDRQSLALLTGRSVHTIRARCHVVKHRNGKALYDLDDAELTLAATPTRDRMVAHTALPL